MDFYKLNCFISLAERLNFSEASKYLYISQPRLSLQIKDIEKQLNVQLFIRDTHSVSLTPAGKVFLEEAKAIVKNYEAAIEKTRQSSCGFNGCLNIIFFDPVSGFVLPVLINKFSQAYPHIGVSLNQMKAEEFYRALYCMEADIGITPELGIEKETGLDKQVLFSERLCVAVSNRHPLASKTSVSLSELADEEFVMLNRAFAPFYPELIQRIFSRKGFMPKSIKETDRLDLMFLYVEAGIGIGIVPKSLSTKWPSQCMRIIDIEEDNAGGDVVVTWKKGLENPLISLFLNEAKSFKLS